MSRAPLFVLALVVGCGHAPAPRGPVAQKKAPNAAEEDATTRERIQTWLQEKLDENEHRAFGIVVIDKDETHTYGFGPRSAKDPRPMDADTTFELGSIAKTMVGVLLADAAERGQLGLDDPAEKWLPEGFSLSPKLRPVTVAQLATHTAGFPWFPDNWVGVDPRTHRTRYTRDAFREFLKTFEPASPPGTTFQYGNTDTALLALVLAERARLPFGKLISERLFQRLNMQRTTVADHAQKDTNRLAAYAADELVSPRIDDSPFAPTCAIRSTLGDTARYMRAALGEPSPLRAAFALAQKPRFDLDETNTRHVALGWDTNSRFESVSKNGVVEGYRTSMTLYPRSRQGVFLVANGEGVDTDALAWDIAANEFAPEPVGLDDHSPWVVKEAPKSAQRVAVSFDSLVRLEGIEAPTCVRPGEKLAVTFYFRCIAPTNGDFGVFVHADSTTGAAARLRADHFPNGGKGSTVQWLADELVRDDFSLAIPKDYAGKSLVLWTGLVDDGARLDAVEESGESEVVDQRYRGPTITVGACP